MTEIWYALGPLIAAAVAGFFSWKIAHRKTSGTVDTSEADTLWAASEKMRDELRADMERMRLRMLEAETRAADAEKRADLAQKEIYFLHQEVFELRTRIIAVEQDGKMKSEKTPDA